MVKNPFLIALLILVPLIVHLKRVPTPTDLLSVFPGYRDEGDLFTYWKSHVLIALSLFSLQFWKSKFSPILFWLSVIFLNCVLLSTIFSEFPYLSVWGTPNYNEGALVWVAYFVVMLGATQLKPVVLEATLAVCALSVGFFCLLQAIFGNVFMLPLIHPLITSESIEMATRPIYGTLMNPNHLGLFCALLFPYFLSRQRTWWLLPWIAAMAVGSCSRAAMVSILFTSLYILLIYRKAFLPFIPAACAVFLLKPAFHTSIDDRLFIYGKSFWMLLDTPILGKGMATFLNYFPQGLPGTFEHIIVDRPHNMFVQIGHGAGLFALCTFLTIIWLTLSRANLAQRASIVGFCVAALFTDSFVGISPLFFAIVGNSWRETNEETSAS